MIREGILRLTLSKHLLPSRLKKRGGHQERDLEGST